MLAGKWLLNFLWRMEGFDVQVDPSIGHQLSALANTLTSLAGNDEDIADLNSVMDSQEESTVQPNLEVRFCDQFDPLPHMTIILCGCQLYHRPPLPGQ